MLCYYWIWNGFWRKLCLWFWIIIKENRIFYLLFILDFYVRQAFFLWCIKVCFLVNWVRIFIMAFCSWLHELPLCLKMNVRILIRLFGMIRWLVIVFRRLDFVMTLCFLYYFTGLAEGDCDCLGSYSLLFSVWRE